MRLTEKVDNEKFTEAGIRYLTRNQDGIYAVLNKLGEWEDLEEQGRLIELPCKVGTEFYYIAKCRDGRREVWSVTLNTIANILDYEDGIGKWLYFTKEEAEAKLAELGGRHEMGRNMRAKKKTPDDRRKKYYISDKELEKIKREVAEDVNRKSCLLCMAAMADHLNLTEDEICETAEVITRWATYLDEKIISINDVAEVIKNKTGIEFGGF